MHTTSAPLARGTVTRWRAIAYSLDTRTPNPEIKTMRLGVFGGSFDPVHNGHLTLAEVTLAQAALDEVWLMPTAQQPFKPAGPRAEASDRCAMIELAIAGRDGLRLRRDEVDRGGTSYTVDTLRALREQLPDAEMFILLGADAVRDLPNWLEPREVCRLATPLVVHRAGESEPNLDSLQDLLTPRAWRELCDCQVEMPPVPISSSQIRARLAAGQSIAGLTPDAVCHYIRERHLYLRDRSHVE